MRKGPGRRIVVMMLVAAVTTTLLPAAAAAADGDDHERLTAGLGEDDFFWDFVETDAGRAYRTTTIENDVVLQQPPESAQYVAAGDEFTGDPLGLVVYPLESRRYTLGTDKIGVYVCTWSGAPGSANLDDVTAVLNGEVKDYFTANSEGAYNPVFTARKTVTSDANDEFDCVDKIKASNPVTSDNGIIAVLNNAQNGGLATSGFFCALPCDGSTGPSTFPANNRWAVVDGGSVSPPDFIPPNDEPHLTTAVHEIGHTLGWPHSYSTETNEYDNPIDVMSGNLIADFTYRVDSPYGTVAWNRYRSGWIPPADVLVYEGGVETVTIAPTGKPGIQMVVFPTDVEYSFVTLDARRSFGIDAIPDEFQGVSAHYIEQICGDPNNPSVCWGTAAGVFSYPPSADAIDHVTAAGESARMDLDKGATLVAHGTKVSVVSGTDKGYVVKLIGFSDTGSSTFLNDIIWLAEEGITKGCGGTKYCPSSFVTRGQMAAFLVRALGLTDSGDTDFIDDNDSIFEADIEKLAAAGITKGCNPPTNDRFCPDNPVTRGQMAAFLKRAFGLTDQGTVDFIDDDDSVFEADIEKLAAAGITKGCNPPTNDRFCPDAHVTRGQMAAFLKRSEPLLP